MLLLKNVSKVFNASIRKSSVDVTKKVEGGRIEQWKRYWITLGVDYKEAVKDTIEECKQKPKKALFYGIVLTALGYAIKENPDDLEYKDQLQRHLNDSAFISSKVRNAETAEHFKYVVNCYNQGIVRRTSFGLGSILWVDNFQRECGSFEATTPYLKPSWLTFYTRIFDVGFCSRWWNLEKKFENFDVNTQEWNEKSS